MLVPDHFLPLDPGVAWEIIDRHGFGTLVTAEPGQQPIGSPLPFLGRPGNGAGGSLIGHIARANPQLRTLLTPRTRALVIFQGPSAFVSASYFRARDSVPTWDHVTVHVSGRPSLISGDAETLGVLAETVAHFEQQIGSEWRLNLEDPYVRDLARGVAAFTIEVDRIETNLKLSQNIEPRVRQRIAGGLLAAGHHALTAAMVRETGLELSAVTAEASCHPAPTPQVPRG